jgi:hypothetical protein
MSVYDVRRFGGVVQADAGYADGVSGSFDAGAEGFYGVEGCQGVFGGEVVVDGDGVFGEERGECDPVRDGLIGGGGEFAL